jgi:peptidoglycan hydrolase-like protein with peptidoglycan-binding domain
MTISSIVKLAFLSASILPFIAVGEAAAGDTAPLQIIVSKDTQSLVVYDGDEIVTTSRVSTGKPGHTTPSGIFSILEKNKIHKSNIYSNAPMPWMQRLTWSGIALHESSSVPSYPASHGCVRLPAAFAKQLYGMTERGFHVIISDAAVVPTMVNSATLFTPLHSDQAPELLSDANLRPAMAEANSGPVEVASNDVLPKMGASARLILDSQRPPIKILVTRRSERDQIRDVQAILSDLGLYGGELDGGHGKLTTNAVKAFQAAHAMEEDGKMSPQFIQKLYQITGHGTPANGQLFVRRNFKPLFDAPIAIKDPQKPLGTHFFEARDLKYSSQQATWYGVTLDNHISAQAANRLGITDTASPTTAEDSLARIDIPADIRNRIGTLLGEGSSLTITDIGDSSETGLGTDFVTITKKTPVNQTNG